MLLINYPFKNKILNRIIYIQYVNSLRAVKSMAPYPWPDTRLLQKGDILDAIESSRFF